MMRMANGRMMKRAPLYLPLPPSPPPLLTGGWALPLVYTEPNVISFISTSILSSCVRRKVPPSLISVRSASFITALLWSPPPSPLCGSIGTTALSALSLSAPHHNASPQRYRATSSSSPSFPPLLSHSARYSSSNQPLALAALASPPSIPPPPPLLSHVITCTYHTHLSLSIRRILHELVLPHPTVSLWLPAPPELNVLTFSLHRGSVFMLHCTVVGVDISAVIRRNVRAEAVGLARVVTAGEEEQWNSDWVDGLCGHVGVESIQCASLQHLRELIHFAVHQPLHSTPLS